MTVDFPPGFAWPSVLTPRAVAYVAGWAVGLGRCHVAKAEVMRDRDADGPVLAVVVDVLAPREAKEFQPFSVLHRPSEFGWEPGQPARYVLGIELAELNERAERVEDVVDMEAMAKQCADIIYAAVEDDRLHGHRPRCPARDDSGTCECMALPRFHEEAFGDPLPPPPDFDRVTWLIFVDGQNRKSIGEMVGAVMRHYEGKANPMLAKLAFEKLAAECGHEVKT